MSDRFTITSLRKSLATTFPGVEFSYGTAGRGRMRGHSVAWTGGPQEPDVRSAARVPWRSVYHFIRRATQEETEAYLAAEEAARPAREADAERAREARRAAGKDQAAETRRKNAEALQKLENRFPGVVFKVKGGEPFWTNGPSVEAVATLLDVSAWRTHRSLTKDVLAASLEHERTRLDEADALARVETRMARTRRRLDLSQKRARVVAKGKAKRALGARQLRFDFGKGHERTRTSGTGIPVSLDGGSLANSSSIRTESTTV